MAMITLKTLTARVVRRTYPICRTHEGSDLILDISAASDARHLHDDHTRQEIEYQDEEIARNAIYTKY